MSATIPTALNPDAAGRAARTTAHAARHRCGGNPAPFDRSPNVPRGIAACIKALALACLLVPGQAVFAQNAYTLPLVLPAS